MSERDLSIEFPPIGENPALDLLFLCVQESGAHFVQGTTNSTTSLERFSTPSYKLAYFVRVMPKLFATPSNIPTQDYKGRNIFDRFDKDFKIVDKNLFEERVQGIRHSEHTQELITRYLVESLPDIVRSQTIVIYNQLQALDRKYPYKKPVFVGYEERIIRQLLIKFDIFLPILDLSIEYVETIRDIVKDTLKELTNIDELPTINPKEIDLNTGSGMHKPNIVEMELVKFHYKIPAPKDADIGTLLFMLSIFMLRENMSSRNNERPKISDIYESSHWVDIKLVDNILKLKSGIPSLYEEVASRHLRLVRDGITSTYYYTNIEKEVVAEYRTYYYSHRSMQDFVRNEFIGVLNEVIKNQIDMLREQLQHLNQTNKTQDEITNMLVDIIRKYCPYTNKILDQETLITEIRKQLGD